MRFRSAAAPLLAVCAALVLWTSPARPVAAGPAPVRWSHRSTAAGDIPPADVGRQAAAVVLDVDGDGADGFAIAGWSDETSMVWFRRMGDGWKRYLLDDRQSHIEAGGACFDIDGDGDTDILQGGSWATNEVWWWENPAPDFDPDRPWKRHTIKDQGAKQHHDQIFGDFDGDGTTELVFWNQRGRKLLISDVPRNPRRKENWSFHALWKWPQQFKYEGLDRCDIDGDGTLDLVGGGHWFEHRKGAEYAAHRVDDYGKSRSAAADLIEGGRPEIVLNSGDGVGPLNLYQWNDGRWKKRTLVEKMDHGHTLEVGDLNGDGHADIYAAEMHSPGPGQNCRQMVLYGDGRGNFTRQVISTGIGTHEGRLGDLDGDGDPDILQKDFQHERRVDVWLNEGPRQR